MTLEDALLRVKSLSWKLLSTHSSIARNTALIVACTKCSLVQETTIYSPKLKRCKQCHLDNRHKAYVEKLRVKLSEAGLILVSYASAKLPAKAVCKAKSHPLCVEGQYLAKLKYCKICEPSRGGFGSKYPSELFPSELANLGYKLIAQLTDAGSLSVVRIQCLQCEDTKEVVYSSTTKYKKCDSCNLVKNREIRMELIQSFLPENHKILKYTHSNRSIDLLCSNTNTTFQAHPAPITRNKAYACPHCSDNKKERRLRLIHESLGTYWKLGEILTEDTFLVSCPENHTKPVNFRRRKAGLKSCDVCRTEGTREKNEESVREQLKRWGFTLTSKYINEATLLTLLCKADHNITTTWQSLRTNKGGCYDCNYRTQESVAEIETLSWVKTLGLTVEHYKPGRFEYDIYLPKHKLAVEYHGLYYHSEKRTSSPQYHLNKYIEAKNLGLTVIQTWSDEWIYRPEVVKSEILRTANLLPSTHQMNDCFLRLLKGDHADVESFLSSYLLGHRSDFDKAWCVYDQKGKMLATTTLKGNTSTHFCVTRDHTKIEGLITGLLDVLPETLTVASNNRYPKDVELLALGFTEIGQSSPASEAFSGNRRKVTGTNLVWDAGYTLYSRP